MFEDGKLEYFIQGYFNQVNSYATKSDALTVLKSIL